MTEIDRLTDATLDELKQGYTESPDHYTCLCCGEQFEKGIIYPEGGRLYEAHCFTRHHIESAHGSVFAYLLSLDKSATGLTDLQRRLLGLFAEGQSDADVQKELGLGATSTVRNHRFLLKERERQAKLFLALMELLRAKDQAPEGAKATAPKAPGRPKPTAAETPEAKVLQKYFPHGTDGPLTKLPRSHEHRKLVLGQISQRFHRGRRYTEAEVNALLEPIFADYASLRRYMVDYGFIERIPDGSQYWLREQEERPVQTNRRKELQELAKEMKVEAGVYQIKNTKNGKLFIQTSRNIKSTGTQFMQLEMGRSPFQDLQREFNEFGRDAFTIEVLEVLEEPKEGPFDLNDALKKLKERWLERLQPYGERGYHTRPVKKG